MDKQTLINILEKFKADELDIDTVADKLSSISYEDIGYAKVDHHRSLRNGYPEVIYCEGKSKEQIAGIMEKLAEKNSNVLGTRLSTESYIYLKERHPSLDYEAMSRVMTLKVKPIEMIGKGQIAVVTAGTSDMYVAEEAAITAEFLGNKVIRIYDAGVAGIHRLLSKQEELRRCRVVIAVAGMEGALPSVLGGLVEVPVIAVPTSVGYGANFGGLSALLTMLNSCSSGLSVVNIDNGFGAGYLASTINRL